MAFLQSHPALFRKFDEAVENTWSPQRFIAEIRDTPWFQKHAASARAWGILKSTDPATAKNQLGQTMATINDAANAMGASLSTAQLKRVADNALMFGMDQSSLQNVLAGFVHYDAKLGGFQGSAGQNENHLQDIARKNGLTFNKGMYSKWVQAIANGDSTVSDYESYIRNEASKAFPSYTDQLSAGGDLADIASPYTNSMANILELPETGIDMFNPTIRSALQARDKDGKITSKPLYQFEQELRQDPRWLQTNNAKTTLNGMTHSVLQSFGLMS